MKETQLQELITANTNEEGVVNFIEVSKSINDITNGLIAKNKPDMEKLNNESIANFLKENNFDNMASFSAFVKQGATVNSEQLNEYKTTIETQKTKMEKLLGIQKDYTTLQQQSAISKLGITDQDEIELLEYKVNKTVTDDITFKDALELYVKDNPNRFQTQKTPYKTTGKSGIQSSNKTQKMAWEIALEEKTGIKL